MTTLKNRITEIATQYFGLGALVPNSKKGREVYVDQFSKAILLDVEKIVGESEPNNFHGASYRNALRQEILEKLR